MNENKREMARRLAVMAFSVALSVGVVAAWYGADALLTRRPAPPSRDDRLAAAVASMTASVKDDGKFDYIIDLLRGRVMSSTNEVRQAGSAMALGEYLLYVDASDSAVRAALERVIGRMWRVSQALPAGGSVVVGDKGMAAAKTGSTALALLAAIYYEQATGDARYASEIAAWKDGLMTLYKPTAGFRANPERDAEEAYYNGESWLALALHYHYYKDENVRGVLEKLAEYLPEQFPIFHSEFFHWGTPAAVQSIDDGIAVEKLTEWVGTQAESYMGWRKKRPQTPTDFPGCAFEFGLLRASRVLPDPSEARAFAAAQQAISDLGQVMGELAPGMPLPKVARKYAGAYLSSFSGVSTRIDSTMHCVDTLVEMKRLGVETPPLAADPWAGLWEPPC